MSNELKGVYSIVLACLIWGSLNVIFAALAPMPAFDIVAHRILWGMVALVIWLLIKSRGAELMGLLRDKYAMKWASIAAVLIAVNWAGFVYAAQNGYALEAGLGYFIFPLVTAAFGAIFKGEKINFAQGIAIAAAFIAVIILTYGLGKVPWIALFLAVSFALYGLVKSNVSYGPAIGVALENIILTPFALIWLMVISKAEVGFFSGGNYAGLLIATGAATALALLSLSTATKLISMFMVGFLSYLNPLIQTFNATIFLGEEFTKWHMIAFPIIFAGSAFYVWDLWRRSVRTKQKAR